MVFRHASTPWKRGNNNYGFLIVKLNYTLTADYCFEYFSPIVFHKMQDSKDEKPEVAARNYKQEILNLLPKSYLKQSSDLTANENETTKGIFIDKKKTNFYFCE